MDVEDENVSGNFNDAAKEKTHEPEQEKGELTKEFNHEISEDAQKDDEPKLQYTAEPPGMGRFRGVQNSNELAVSLKDQQASRTKETQERYKTKFNKAAKEKTDHDDGLDR